MLLVRTTPRSECARRTDGLTLLLADLQRPEVEISPIDKIGRNAVASCEVRYNDLPVPESERIGEEGKGFSYLLDGLNAERILVASEALGTGRAALEELLTAAADVGLGETEAAASVRSGLNAGRPRTPPPPRPHIEGPHPRPVAEHRQRSRDGTGGVGRHRGGLRRSP